MNQICYLNCVLTADESFFVELSIHLPIILDQQLGILHL